jgi:hypothetical protein
VKSFRVHFCGIKKSSLHDRPRLTGQIELLEKAAPIPGVASPGTLFHFEKQGITIAIGKPTNKPLGISARFPFQPKLMARPAPVMHQTGFQGFRERVPVHPAHHQNPARGGGFPHNRRDQPIGSVLKIEIHSVRLKHYLSVQTCSSGGGTGETNRRVGMKTGDK